MPDTRLNYRVEGHGTPLLLVHGFMISFNIWKNLAPLLRPHLKLIIVEMPGVGESPPVSDHEEALQVSIDGIEEIRRKLGIDRWYVLSYSTGSRVAEAYARAFPGHVCAAIFLCALLIDAHKARGLRTGLRLDQRFPVFGDWVLSGWRLRFLVSLLGFNLIPNRLADEWYTEISSRPMSLRKATIWAMAELADKPFSVPVPYSFIWGDRDLVPRMPRTAGPRDAFVHGTHSAPVEAAEEVAKLVLALCADRQGCDDTAASEPTTDT